MVSTKVFTARRIHTMSPSAPTAEAVAVREGRIVAVGSLADMAGYEPYELDDRFAEAVLLPGFVEAHCHVMAGGMWNFTYVGYFDRTDPEGRVWSGCRDTASVVARLAEVAATMDADPDVSPGEPLVAWGLDPIYLQGDRLDADDLDGASGQRPIFVFHASAHLATVNTAMLELSGIDADTRVPGVSRRPDGTPDGELQEPAAMSLARPGFSRIVGAMRGPEPIRTLGRLANRAGVTTFADLGTTRPDTDEGRQAWIDAVEDPSFPARAVVAGSLMGGSGSPAERARVTTELVAHNTAKLRFGLVKIVLDGSIQGLTARVGFPGYHNGAPNGLWLIPPEQMPELVGAFHRAGLTIHCHCNGDEAVDVFLDAVEQALRENPRFDHRHTVQHCQLTTEAQYRRMARLGMCANIFSNHIYYWGDQHVAVTVGPTRAAAMDACATAARLGVPFAVHTDAPVTPLSPLASVWSAVTRTTATGRVLGPGERIPVGQALRAVTIDAAFQLNLDDQVGSIEVGKFADFAVLGEDPHEVAPAELGSIPVLGTVLGGRVFTVPAGVGG